MTVYIDEVLLMNFLLDLLILICTTIVLKRKVKIRRLFLGALVGTLTTLMLFLKVSSLVLFLIKIMMAILMIITTFSYCNIKYTLQNLFYLYVISIVLGGALYLINIQLYYQQDGLTVYQNGLSLNFILVIILSPIIIYLYIKQTKSLKDNYANYYHVSIYLNDLTVINAVGFRDTGNHLLDPYTRKPIILINKKLVPLSSDTPHILVPYHALNTTSMLKCVKPKKIIIEGIGTKHHFLLGLSEEEIGIDGVDCILHPGLF